MLRNANKSLSRFTVELAVRGIDEVTDPSAQQEFDFELSMRPHILKKKVSMDHENHQLIIRIVIEGIDPQRTAQGASEELLEIAAVLLNKIDGMQIVVRKVEQN